MDWVQILRETDKFHYGVVARIFLKIYQGKLFTQKGWAGFPLFQNDFENQNGCSLGFYLSDKTGEWMTCKEKNIKFFKNNYTFLYDLF